MRRYERTRKPLWAVISVTAAVAFGAAIFVGGIHYSVQQSSAQEKTSETTPKKKPSAAPMAKKSERVAAPPFQVPFPTPPETAKPEKAVPPEAVAQKGDSIEVLLRELKTAVADRPQPIVEPTEKPRTMTTKEYERGKKLAESWIKKFAVDGTGGTPNPIAAFNYRLVGGEVRLLAETLIPKTMKMWIREGMKQEFDRWPLATIDRKASTMAQYRAILDPVKREMLKARLPWKERSAIYEKLAAITGDSRPWSLLHPFDDLDGNEMRTALRAAEKAEARGILALTAEEREALLDADAIEYFEKKLRTANAK